MSQPASLSSHSAAKSAQTPAASTGRDNAYANIAMPDQIPTLPPSFKTKTLLLTGSSTEAFRQAIKTYFNTTFSTYESLFELIRHDTGYYLRAEPLRHPLIFYFAHTATFFINKMMLARMIDRRVNSHFESMFAIGVDEMSWDDLNESHYDWPAVEAVRDYRSKVRSLVNQVIDELDITLPIDPDQPAWTILMGIEHERIHLETSSVIIRMLPLDQVQPSALWSPCLDPGADINDNLHNNNPMHPLAAQMIEMGKPKEDATYGWDNEYGCLTVSVPAFKASQSLISNQEFLAFVEDEGYHKTQYWCEEGKAWLAYTKARHPRFWLNKQGQYYQRNLTQEMPLPLAWPVEVNYLEAKAYCNWASERSGQIIRLPTEAEWMVLRQGIALDQPTWDQAPGNLNLEYYASSCPVNWFGVNYQGSMFYDVIGNVWQWTESPIDALPGFEVHPLYDDFSTPTFDGKHNLMKGGSWISTGNEALKHSRYAFRRHFFQHAGFRIVQASSDHLPGVQVNVYETDALVSQYLEFHYGAEYFDTPNYPQDLVKIVLEHVPPEQRKRALDLGCAVGRASFELSRWFEHVDGIDFSARFIQSGVALLEQGLLRYTVPTEGDLVEYKEVSLVELGFSSEPNNLHFSQGDAANLKPQFCDYDLVLASNLIDRLPRPRQFLSHIVSRIQPGGFLMLTSPYTWLEEYTEKAQWLGGFKKDGENVTTQRALEEILQADFSLMAQQDQPFVIRETARKFQHTLAQVTVWQRKTK